MALLATQTGVNFLKCCPKERLEIKACLQNDTAFSNRGNETIAKFFLWKVANQAVQVASHGLAIIGTCEHNVFPLI